MRARLALAGNWLILAHKGSVTPLGMVCMPIEVMLVHFLAVVRVHHMEVWIVHLHKILMRVRIIILLICLLGAERLRLVEHHLSRLNTAKTWALSILAFVSILILEKVLVLQLRKCLASLHRF